MFVKGCGAFLRSWNRACKKLFKGFTLTELLVVIVVIGVLSAVALPQFNKVVESRKTTEAEEMMASIRSEQEKRCTLDKPYVGKFKMIENVLASASVAPEESSADTQNYTYTLEKTGMSAQSKGKYSYELKMPSYKAGQLCCEGADCVKLNKNYPLCSEVSFDPSPAECAATDICSDCSCPDYAAANRCACDSSYASANPCACQPNTCACPSYASANPTVCGCPSGQELWNGSCKPVCSGGQVRDPSNGSCECPSGLTWNGTSCAKECNASEANGCSSSGGTWNASSCTCSCSAGRTWTGNKCECPAETPYFYSNKCNVCPSGKYLNNGVCCPTGQISKDGKTCVYAYKPERVSVGILVDCHNSYSFIDKNTCRRTGALSYFVGGSLPNVAAGGGCTFHHAYYYGGLWWNGGQHQGYSIGKCNTSITDQTFCDQQCKGASCTAKCIVSESYPSTCGVYNCSNGRHCDNSSGSGTMLRCVRI